MVAMSNKAPREKFNSQPLGTPDRWAPVQRERSPLRRRIAVGAAATAAVVAVAVGGVELAGRAIGNQDDLARQAREESERQSNGDYLPSDPSETTLSVSDQTPTTEAAVVGPEEGGNVINDGQGGEIPGTIPDAPMQVPGTQSDEAGS